MDTGTDAFKMSGPVIALPATPCPAQGCEDAQEEVDAEEAISAPSSSTSSSMRLDLEMIEGQPVPQS
jgi:hypothetical protein